MSCSHWLCCCSSRSAAKHSTAQVELDETSVVRAGATSHHCPSVSSSKDPLHPNHQEEAQKGKSQTPKHTTSSSRAQSKRAAQQLVTTSSAAALITSPVPLERLHRSASTPTRKHKKLQVGPLLQTKKTKTRFYIPLTTLSQHLCSHFVVNLTFCCNFTFIIVRKRLQISCTV